MQRIAKSEEQPTLRRAVLATKSTASPSSAAALRKRLGVYGMRTSRGPAAVKPDLPSAESLTPKKPGACRGLMPGEIELAKKAFGDKVSYGRVRICNGTAHNPIAWIAFKNGNPAITLGKSIYIAEGYSADFSKAGPSGVELFMHEMTHVWQYGELGIAPFVVRYFRELAASGFDANATYDYELGKTPFGGATLEAQAEMVGDYNEARMGGDEEKADLLEQNLDQSGIHGL